MKGVILTQGQPFRINPDACERSRLKIQRKFNAFMAATWRPVEKIIFCFGIFSKLRQESRVYRWLRGGVGAEWTSAGAIRTTICPFALCSLVNVSRGKRIKDKPLTVFASTTWFPVDRATSTFCTVPSGRSWATKTPVAPAGCAARSRACAVGFALGAFGGGVGSASSVPENMSNMIAKQVIPVFMDDGLRNLTRIRRENPACHGLIVKGKRISCPPPHHLLIRVALPVQEYDYEHGFPLIRSLRASTQRSTSVLFSFVLSLLIVAGSFAVRQSKTILARWSWAGCTHRCTHWATKYTTAINAAIETSTAIAKFVKVCTASRRILGRIFVGQSQSAQESADDMPLTRPVIRRSKTILARSSVRERANALDCGRASRRRKAFRCASGWAIGTPRLMIGHRAKSGRCFFGADKIPKCPS